MEFATVRRRLVPWLGISALTVLVGGCTTTENGVVRGDTRNQVIISVRDQKLTVIQPDHHRVTFPISTSKFGFGDRRGSYATPLGELEVAQKVGTGAPAGSVFRSRVRTGEIVRVDAPGRDAIVTRILALRGLETGNKDAWARGIYIHGTPEERNIGRPSSYGCIRMRSRDVIALYDMVKVGARVQIIDTTMTQAIASNIVTPPPAPAPAVQPATAPVGPAVATANVAPANAKSDPASAKAMSAAVAADKKTEAAAGTVAPTPVAPAPAPAARLAAAAAVPAKLAEPAKPAGVPAKKEWAGTPSKLLAKSAEADAKAKTAKPIGAARPPSGVSGTATETSYNPNASSRDISRSSLDSL